MTLALSLTLALTLNPNQEAKLSRELVQLEKYMVERKKKRDQRDEDDDGGRRVRGAEISQNEMF